MKSNGAKQIGMRKREHIETLLYTLPATLLVTIIIYIPFLLSGYYSLTEWNGISKTAVFIGADNFVQLFTGDKDFINSLIFTGKYALLFIILSNILALGIASALVQRLKTAHVMRAIFFVPYIISMTIVGFIWKFIFSQGFAKLYEVTNWEVWNLSWLGDGKLAFYSIVIVGVWQSLGFYIVLYIAGLQAVPQDVLEAASIDGAGPVKRFFGVVIPLLGPSITTCIFMSLTNSLKVFDIILALTKGGPGGSTYSVTLEIYREAFQNNNYGLGAAKSILFFVIILVLTQVVLKLFSSREVEL